VSESLWNRVRRALQREQRDIEEILDEKERELAATPEEGLTIAQERVAKADDEFEKLKRQIEGNANS
jgi:hypothetical protein